MNSWAVSGGPVHTPGRRYMPGLDGLRGLALVVVVAFHLEVPGFGGGFLGVSVFFTLSGYLITDLMLSAAGQGTFTLRNFWLARARRLLPAVVTMVLLVLTWIRVTGVEAGNVREPAVTALAYANNWWLIVGETSYFTEFQNSPLTHLWSLSIEEQFYVLWPLVVAAACYKRLRRGLVGVLALAGVVASTAAMVVLFDPADTSRAYFGTDTRAAELLAGAALAAAWPSARLRAYVSYAARRTIDSCGAVALGLLAVAVATVDGDASTLYRGGFAVVAVASAITVAALAHPASRLGQLLGVAPLRWVGSRSYGLYLWHVPILALAPWLDSGGVTDAADRLSVVAAAMVFAEVSYRVVEQPIRHQGLQRAIAETVQVARHPFDRRLPRIAALVAIGVFAVPGGSAVAGHGDVDGAVSASSGEEVVLSVAVASARPLLGAEAVEAQAWRSSEPCRSVVHIGDSTSLGLVSTSYIPNVEEQITARYAEQGILEQHYEIAGGRAIIESFRGSPNALDSARRWILQSYRGCWVFALGTTDSANFSARHVGPPADRIDMMMEIAGGMPVLWVNVRTVLDEGHWRNENMEAFNRALEAACDRYDNLRILDFAASTREEWFLSDGIHNNTPGYVDRAEVIAAGLAAAFPVQHNQCVISPNGVTPPRGGAPHVRTSEPAPTDGEVLPVPTAQGTGSEDAPLG